MRKGERAGRTVVLRLRFDDFTRATRSLTMRSATAHTDTILAAAQALLAESVPLIRTRGLTLLGVSVANLHDGAQLALPLEAASGALDRAVDEVRARYGVAALTRGVLVGRDQGLTVPLLPD
jgi:DNA polymerase-4